MEDKKKKISDNVAAGMGSTIGAAAGIVAGSVVAQPSEAAENPSEVEIQNVAAPHHEYHTPPIHESVQVVEVEPSTPESNAEEVVTPEQTEPTQLNPEIINSGKVDVLEYITERDASGSEYDVAVLKVDGQNVVIGDLNQDGYGDVMVSDLNADGVIDPNEAIDIRDQQISMEPFREAALGPTEDIADVNIDPDYTNDADVQDYIA